MPRAAGHILVEVIVAGGEDVESGALLVSDHHRMGGPQNCSRNHGSIIAVSSGLPHMFSVYQRGRGHDPVTVAGSIKSFVAVNAISSPLSSRLSERAQLYPNIP